MKPFLALARPRALDRLVPSVAPQEHLCRKNWKVSSECDGTCLCKSVPIMCWLHCVVLHTPQIC